MCVSFLILGNRTAVLLHWRVLPRSQRAALHLRWASFSSFICCSEFPRPFIFCAFVTFIESYFQITVVSGVSVSIFVWFFFFKLFFVFCFFQCSPADGEFHLFTKTVFSFTFSSLSNFPCGSLCVCQMSFHFIFILFEILK